LDSSQQPTRYFDCEDPDNRRIFETAGFDTLRALLAKYRLVVFDEAQKCSTIGQVLKLIHDHIPDVQVIATGSSSFDLSHKITESLTGRKWKSILYPISIQEIVQDRDPIFALKHVQDFLLYGQYPDVLAADVFEKKEILNELATSYILKDVFMLQDVRNPEVLDRLPQLLALQISSQVSYHELATQLGVNQDTIVRYIELLEQAFVIFRLPAFSRNQKNEVTKSRKIYFYDLGVRNALIQNFRPLDVRDDTGRLWENFCIIERKKYLQAQHIQHKMYFWRNYQQQEIDYIEEQDGQIHVVELKWNP